MKVLRIFKKPVFLITLVVLAAILSVSMIAVGAADADLGGSVSTYQVGMQGSVMFKLTLTDAGKGMADTDYYSVTVGDRDCGNYPVNRVKADGNAIVVRLKPTEMSKKVTVTAVKGSETRVVWSGSVRGYAETVLGRSDLSASHNVMRAMLNWGAKTETKFIKDSVSTTADGIFARDTDPMNAVTPATITVPEHAKSTVDGIFTSGSTEIILGEGNVTLRFKLNATAGLGTLTATVSRGGWDSPKETQVTYDSKEGCYTVDIDGISTLLFDKVYTVSIDDKNGNSVTAYASVLENLSGILNNKGTDQSEDIKNVAKTLYQFYLLSANKTDLDCQHNVSGYWIPTSVTGKDRYMCAVCFEQLVSENVEIYMSPEDLKNNAKFDRGSADSAIMNDGAFPYIRYSNPKPNENYQIQYSIIPANNEAVTGRYLVMKYRYQKETASSFLTMYACTKGNEKSWSTGNIRHHLVNNKSANYDGKWNVLVVDLALYKGTTSNSVYVPNESGEYIAGAVYLRLFGNDFDNPWNGECKNPTETDFIDFAYIAMVDELADLKEFVSEPTYHFGYNNNWFHTHYTFSNMCYGALDRWGVDKGEQDTVYQRWTITETNHSATGCVNCGIEAIPEADHTYGNVGGVRKCTVCGYVNAGLFLSAEDFNSKLANANKTDFTQKYVADQGEFPYFHVERKAVTKGNRYEINIVDLFPKGTEVKGKYLIIKYRSENSATSDKTNSMTIFGDTASDVKNYTNKYNYYVIDSGENAGNWYVMVCDLSKINEKFATENAKNLYIRLFGKDWDGSGMTNAAVGDYFDIAYMAIVDEEADIKNIVTDKTYDYTASSTTSVTKNTETNQAVN